MKTITDETKEINVKEFAETIKNLSLNYNKKNKGDEGVTVVYFIKCVDPSLRFPLVKIGYTNNLNRRLKEIRSMPFKIVLLAAIPGGRGLEKRLHSFFKPKQLHKKGEWFYLIGMLKMFLDYMVYPSDCWACHYQVYGYEEGTFRTIPLCTYKNEGGNKYPQLSKRMLKTKNAPWCPYKGVCL